MVLEDSLLESFPEESGEYKAIILRLDDKPALLLGMNNKLHSYILKDFLKKNNVNYNYMSKKLSSGFIVHIPESKGSRYDVVCMGKLEINIREKTFRLKGNSHDYGLKINREGIDIVKSLYPDWNVSL
ncbi:MAG: hypothetical protein AABW81_01205 [Nanoarchaeota archaeon]